MHTLCHWARSHVIKDLRKRHWTWLTFKGPGNQYYELIIRYNCQNQNSEWHNLTFLFKFQVPKRVMYSEDTNQTSELWLLCSIAHRFPSLCYRMSANYRELKLALGWSLVMSGKVAISQYLAWMVSKLQSKYRDLY